LSLLILRVGERRGTSGVMFPDEGTICKEAAYNTTWKGLTVLIHETLIMVEGAM